MNTILFVISIILTIGLLIVAAVSITKGIFYATDNIRKKLNPRSSKRKDKVDVLFRFWPSDILYLYFLSCIIFDNTWIDVAKFLTVGSILLHSIIIFKYFNKEYEKSTTNFLEDIFCFLMSVFLGLFYFVCAAPFLVLCYRLPYLIFIKIPSLIYRFVRTRINYDTTRNALPQNSKNDGGNTESEINNRYRNRSVNPKNIGFIICPFCKTYLQLPINSEGKNAQCQQCKNKFTIPNKFPHPLVKAKRTNKIRYP